VKAGIRTVCAAVLLAAAAARGDPPSDVACPALEDGFIPCAQDPGDPACAGFVQAAEVLAENFREAVRSDALDGPTLRTRNWWGCKPESLDAVAALLARIDTPAAREVLAGEPYRSLLHGPALAAPVPLTPPGSGCEDVTEAAALAACATRERDAAEAARQQAFERCVARVSAPVAEELRGAEAAWKRNTRMECSAVGGDATQQSLCLASAARERTAGMLAAHPECAGPP
jgi:hypothetical protein